jgi:hypothetical protein
MQVVLLFIKLKAINVNAIQNLTLVLYGLLILFFLKKKIDIKNIKKNLKPKK